MTKIEWTKNRDGSRGKTWNPIVGCSITTPGCTNCYAMRAAWRMSHNPMTPQYYGTAKLVNGNPVWTGKMGLAPDSVLTKPLHRKKPATWFVNSMGDLFHEDVPDEWIDRVFAVMALCPQHRFQILTKRSARMQSYVQKLTEDGPADRLAYVAGQYLGEEADAWVANYINGWSTPTNSRDNNPADGTVVRWPLANVWLGVSVEDQTRADERIPDLLETPAAVRFISAEPLLGPVDLSVPFGGAKVNALSGALPAVPALDWVICGGESGPRARPLHPDWARSLRDQCVAAGVPFFFKQWGEWSPVEFIEDQHDGGGAGYPIDGCSDPNAHHENQECLFWQKGRPVHWPEIETPNAIGVRRVGKKAAGRLLDGREWSQMPGAME